MKKVSIVFTDDPRAMEEMGRQIVEDNPAIYNETVMRVLTSTIDKVKPDLEKSEKERMLYVSIYDYWAYGCTIEEWFYLYFWGKTHAEKKTYITNHERLLYVDHLNHAQDAHILDNKYETYQTFKEFYKREVVLIKDETDYLLFKEFCERHPFFVSKPACWGLAEGVKKNNVSGKTEQELKALFSDLLKNGEAYNKHNKNGINSGGTVLEELIEQVDELALIHPNSVNGIRVTTIRVDEVVHIMHPWFKIGVNGEFVTGGACGSILAGINAQTGIVETFGKTEDCHSYEYHPTTHVKIPGYQIPKWEELIETVKILSNRLPTIAYTGWDMVLTPKGWCVMEGNYKGQFIWELIYERGFRAEFEKMINWKLEKDFWWD